jgi:predicted GNAT family acetyltransferase
MKLKNLVEITIGPEQDTLLTDKELAGIDFSSAKYIMNVEGLPLYVYDTNEYPNQKIYRLMDGDIPVVTIVGMLTVAKPYSTFKINKTLVAKDYQGQGYAKALYSTLFNRLHYNVFSDYQLSSKTLNAWKKGWMVTQSFIYVYNHKKDIFKHIDEVEDVDHNDEWIYCILHKLINENTLIRMDIRFGDTFGQYVNTLHGEEIFDLE